ncbi:MAG: hypothetical protein WC449_00920 [Candidatus Paceibacterota bacterium]
MEIPKEKRLEYFLDGLRRGVDIPILASELGVSPNSLFAYKSGLMFFGLLDKILEKNPDCAKEQQELDELQKFRDQYLVANWRNAALEEILQATGFKNRKVLKTYIRRAKKRGVPIPEREYVPQNMYTAKKEKAEPLATNEKVVTRAPSNPPAKPQTVEKKKSLPEPIEPLPQEEKRPPAPARQPIISSSLKDGEAIPRGPNALDNPDEPGTKVKLPDMSRYGVLDPPKNPIKKEPSHKGMTMEEFDQHRRRLNQEKDKAKTPEELEQEAQAAKEFFKEHLPDY